MNQAAVMTLLEQNADPRGIAHWHDPTLRSFGIGLTKLRKLAKQIGRDHALAQALWQSDVYEAKVLGLLVDDPVQVTRAQAELQVEQLGRGQLAHVFSSCDATLAKTAFVVELAVEWIVSDDAVRRECGYGLLYEISKDKRKSAPDERWFLDRVERMGATWRGEPRSVRMAIAGALLGIGKRTRALNAAAIELATAMGPVENTPGCEPFDVVKHLVKWRG